MVNIFAFAKGDPNSEIYSRKRLRNDSTGIYSIELITKFQIDPKYHETS